jgi:hypothetical protein
LPLSVSIILGVALDGTVFHKTRLLVVMHLKAWVTLMLVNGMKMTESKLLDSNK